MIYRIRRRMHIPWYERHSRVERGENVASETHPISNSFRTSSLAGTFGSPEELLLNYSGGSLSRRRVLTPRRESNRD